MKKVVALILIFACSQLVAKETFLKLETLPKSDYFLFLVGEWQYQFAQGKGIAKYQFNQREHTISGVIHGEINQRHFIGNSLTFFQADGDVWHRRWIDSLGNVLQGKPELIDYQEATGKALQSITQLGEIYFKHIWYNITSDRFETDLLVSRDGKEWKMARRMPYIKNSGHPAEKL